MSDVETEDAMALAKELLEEAKILKERIENLERENSDLRKSSEDVTLMMKKQGWQTFATPHASETFDPLNRTMEDSFNSVGPFTGSGDMITKSRHDELQEWQDAEREMRQ